MREVAHGLTVDGHGRALRIAELPELVRGFEDVKIANIEIYRDRLRDEGVGTDALDLLLPAPVRPEVARLG